MLYVCLYVSLYYSSKEKQFWPITGNPRWCHLAKKLYNLRNRGRQKLVTLQTENVIRSTATNLFKLRCFVSRILQNTFITNTRQMLKASWGRA